MVAEYCRGIFVPPPGVAEVILNRLDPCPYAVTMASLVRSQDAKSF